MVIQIQQGRLLLVWWFGGRADDGDGRTDGGDYGLRTEGGEDGLTVVIVGLTVVWSD